MNPRFDLVWSGLYRVISGGQTGADHGGLIAAFDQGVQTGGEAPEGYRTSNGFNPGLAAYGLTAKGTYVTRTKTNVRSSDGTVLIGYYLDSTGTKLTRNLCTEFKKPFLELNIYKLLQIASIGHLRDHPSAIEELGVHGEALHRFILSNQISVLNVAGNREMKPKYDDSIQYSPVTTCTKHIVDHALFLLDTDDLLIRARPIPES